ncbi:thyrotropin-releasing hormone receptor-like [Amphiura filiformis]|uniref:thyrotropin-releasing hormone receptor-like n=1 Tax=Amphiura filiformis TaxID=82378 RepID=UPI003B210B68
MPTYLTYFASILLITLATVEKYYGICHPFQHRLVTGKSRTVRIIAISWVFGSVLSGLVVLRYAKVEKYCMVYPDEENYTDLPKRIELCVPINDTLLVFSEAVSVIPFFSALVGNVYMYGRIIYALSHRNVTDNTEDSFQLMQRQVRNQVARILIINGIVFFCCQFPYRLLSINVFVQEATGVGFLSMVQYGVLAVIARGLVLINSLANPFVYFLSSANYRQGFREAYCCKRKQKSREMTQTSTFCMSTRPEGKPNDTKL